VRISSHPLSIITDHRDLFNPLSLSSHLLLPSRPLVLALFWCACFLAGSIHVCLLRNPPQRCPQRHNQEDNQFSLSRSLARFRSGSLPHARSLVACLSLALPVDLSLAFFLAFLLLSLTCASSLAPWHPSRLTSRLLYLALACGCPYVHFFDSRIFVQAKARTATSARFDQQILTNDARYAGWQGTRHSSR